MHGLWRGAALLALCLAMLGTGCASNPLTSARNNYFLGRYDIAAQSLSETPESESDKVLFLMERGMMRQSAGQYTGSAQDWLDANLLANRLEYYSITKGATSLLVNDSVLAFRGMSYERNLLHTFSAKSYFALGLWDDAAVEARNGIFRLERRGKFPDDPYSRYLNGFCLEMSGDHDGARLQYDIANEVLDAPIINTHSGRFLLEPNATNAVATQNTHELVCFIGIGRPAYAQGAQHDPRRWGAEPHARLYAKDGSYLGRSYTLNTTDRLAKETLKVHETMRNIKTAARIAIKELTAQAVEEQDELLGEFLRLFLFALERPDTRQWQTLPKWLQVARVPCPEDLDQITIEYIGANGKQIKRQVLREPISRKGKVYASFARAF